MPKPKTEEKPKAKEEIYKSEDDDEDDDDKNIAYSLYMCWINNHQTLIYVQIYIQIYVYYSI